MPTKLQLFIFMMFAFTSFGLRANSIDESNKEIKNNPTTELKIKPQINFLRDDNLLYENEAITISKIYPNPAADQVSFNYRVIDMSANAKIILRNVLGKEVAVFGLEPNAQKLQIPVRDYVAGMYFYTLSINDKNLVTRKFLVKH